MFDIQRSLLLVFMWVDKISLSQSQMTPADPSTLRNFPSLSHLSLTSLSLLALQYTYMLICLSHSEPAHATLLRWAASWVAMVLATGQMYWLSPGCLCCDDPMTQWPQCWDYDFHMAKYIPPCPPYLITIHQLPKLKIQGSPLNPLIFRFHWSLPYGHFTSPNIFGIFPSIGSSIDLAQDLLSSAWSIISITSSSIFSLVFPSLPPFFTP